MPFCNVLDNGDNVYNHSKLISETQGLQKEAAYKIIK